MMTSKIWSAITRKKRVEDNVHDLERVLTLKDLIFLGVGSALGLGAYVLAADIAKHNAGPAVCLSYVFGAISAAVSGLCYAELAARVPKAGSAYSFCYASVGECVAFIIGWNDITGVILSTSSVAKGLSGYLDILCDSKIKTAMTDLLQIDSTFMSPYPDVLAFALIVAMTVIFTAGVKVSVTLLGIFSTLNVIALVTAIIAGATKANFQNWNVSVNQIKPEHRAAAGSGGFLPFGFAGVMSGGTKCFFSYSGFDSPAVAGAEAKHPKRDIPLSIMISLILVFFIYFSISVVITLATPYYAEDDEGPFAQLFDIYGWTSMKWVISAGAICALTGGLMGCIFYLPRIMYAMAKDGLIFRYFASVNKRTNTTIPAIVIPGLISAPLAAFINISPLVDVMTLLGLLQSILIATCIIVLRYRTEETENGTNSDSSIPSTSKISHFITHIFNKNNIQNPSELTSRVVKYSLLVFAVLGGSLSYTIMFASNVLPLYVLVILLGFNIVAILIILLIIFWQPQIKENLYFKVPWVPFIPGISILFNVYLCMQMSLIVALLAIGWILIGLMFYYFYGISHSEENPARKVVCQRLL